MTNKNNKKNKNFSERKVREIPLSSPFIQQDDIKAVVDVLKTRWLSLGPKVPEFEKKFAEYIGTKYAVAVNSGTSALHLAVKSLEIGPGDEIIVTPFSFVASANCVLFEGATPVFVDVEPETFNIDPKKIEEKITSKTKAIIPVDVFGRPSDKEAILKIAKKHNLKVIEDSAEALAATHKGKNVGTFGDCAIFAFYPNKQMTTGEGGVLVTNNKEVYDLCMSYRNQGRGDGEEWHEYIRLGYNYRITDIQCALGISQLKKISTILEKREKVAAEYAKRLGKINGIKLPFDSTKDLKVSWFVYVIQIDSSENKEVFMQELKKRGVECSAYFQPIHLMKFYKEEFGFKQGDFPVCESIAKTTIALPFYTSMKTEDIDYVCKQVTEVQDYLTKTMKK